MKNTRMLNIIVTLLLALMIAGCSPEQETLRIGSILILTGEGASWGIAEKNGIDMAVEHINAEGGLLGKRLVVLHQNDQGDPKQALTAFQQLTKVEDVNLIIGTTWSRTGLSLVDRAKEQKIILVSPSLGVKEFNEANEYLFNVWPHDFILSEKLAEYVYEKGHRKVAIIGAQDVWVKDQTTAFKTRFEKLGGQVLAFVEPDPSTKTVSVEALKIKSVSDKADAFISTTDGVLVGTLIAKRLRELGVILPLYSVTVDAATVTAAEGAYDGMEFLTSLTPDPAFKKEYEEKYGMPIDIGADSAYDAVMLLAQAIRETKSTESDALQSYLHGVKVFQGVSGTLRTDEKGGFTKKFVLKRVINGTITD